MTPPLRRTGILSTALPTLYEFHVLITNEI